MFRRCRGSVSAAVECEAARSRCDLHPALSSSFSSSSNRVPLPPSFLLRSTFPSSLPLFLLLLFVSPSFYRPCFTSSSLLPLIASPLPRQQFFFISSSLHGRPPPPPSSCHCLIYTGVCTWEFREHSADVHPNQVKFFHLTHFPISKSCAINLRNVQKNSINICLQPPAKNPECWLLAKTDAVYFNTFLAMSTKQKNERVDFFSFDIGAQTLFTVMGAALIKWGTCGFSWWSSKS